MRKNKVWLLGKKGLWLIVMLVLLLLGMQGVMGKTSAIEANSIKVKVLDAFNLKTITIEPPKRMSNTSYRIPRSQLPRASVLSAASFRGLRIVDPDDSSRVLIYCNSDVRIPALVSARSPGAPL